MTINNGFSQKINVFHGIYPPEQDVITVGYTALIDKFGLKVPLPDILSAIGQKHSKYQSDGWSIYTLRYLPQATLYGHLLFALKHEGINLTVLKALFDVLNSDEIVTVILTHPTGTFSRRIWFLYEWLKGSLLPLPDIKIGNYVDLLDTKLQYPGPARISKRHRIRNNLPGVPAFCPIVRRTSTLDKYIKENLAARAQEVIGGIHPDIIMRAAAFLLLKDSKASYAIEGEIPPQNRAERWARALSQAGLNELSDKEFLRLQQLIISDFRFVYFGYRFEGGFIGEHERGTGYPLPVHLSARPQDLQILMRGLIETNKLLKESSMDSVIAAASIAFGFVFIHPFEDGNGRIHRYLIHHVLAEKNFNPTHLIFPVSAVILDRIKDYKKILESYSIPRLELIQWRPTSTGNVEVLNDTMDLYRYFDATEQAEFLYDCIKETIKHALPEEIDYLKKYDQMKIFIKNFIDMPDKTIDLLIRFLKQENGRLSARARRKEFSSLKENEVMTLEQKYAEIFLTNATA